MPRNSIDGSIFPGLEQEGRSIAHTDRTPCGKAREVQRSKLGENKRKSEESKASTR